MNYKLTKLLLPLLAISLYSLPVMAHDTDEINKSNEVKSEEHEEHHEKEDTNFKAVFKEGTLNLISPFTFNKDTLNLAFSHNFYANSFPRGSNPAFYFSYTPINKLQLDAALTLRSAPAEFEIGAKYQFLNEFEGDPISLTPRIAYNTRGNIFGLDISATKIFFEDILQLGLGYRVMSNDSADGQTGIVQGIGANTIVRVWKHWHLFGDIVIPFDSNLLTKNGFIWSAGIKKKIPNSPHILTLYVGNSNESTISGRTVSTGLNKYPNLLKAGFVFSIAIPNMTKFPEKLF